MKQIITAGLALIVAATGAALGGDPRNFDSGYEIPSEGYCDQPYVVVTKNGNWLCTLTTGKGREGQAGQHVVATISTDQGRTWSELIDIEPADGPEASWVVPVVTPSGRVYAFYDYNGDRVYQMPGSSTKIRADVIGWYCYRYSDDNGRSWSAKRYRLPMRVTACDRANQWQGTVQIFWGIDKPSVWNGAVFFAFTKLGRYILDNGEGWLYRSDNLLTEPDARRIRWELLPDGDHGIRAGEFGSVQEEHNCVPIGGDKLYCVYRTTMGYPCHTYSEDGGHTWERPVPMTYLPAGRTIRNPRACPKLWRTSEGRYLFWYHNNGHRGYNQGPRYGSRNVAWLSAGVVKNGRMHWSQPEIIRYCSHPLQGCSYPDLLEQDGRFFIATTQKTEARIAAVDRPLLEGLWRQAECNETARDGLALERGSDGLTSSSVTMPRLADLASGEGFSIGMWIRLKTMHSGTVILDSRTKAGRGIVVTTAKGGVLRLDMSDGYAAAGWSCDPGLLEPKTLHHVVFIVDGGPKVISVIVDGILCDGGEDRERPYGYGRFLQTRYVNGRSNEMKPAREIGDVTGAQTARIHSSVRKLRIYQRFLRTSEAIGNFRAGP